MGTYQLAKGAHYLSHNFVTMAIVWLLYVPIQRWMQPGEINPPKTKRIESKTRAELAAT